MFTSNILLGGLEDTFGYFVFSHFHNLIFYYKYLFYGYPFGVEHSILNYSEPLLLLILYSAATLFSSVFVYNITILITYLLTVFTSIKFFSRFITVRWLAAILGLIYTTSPYFLYHSQAHPQLTQIWLFILFMNILLKNEYSIKQSILIGLLIGTIGLVSNYIGLFTLLFFSLYRGLYILRSKSVVDVKHNITHLLITNIVALCVIAAWLVPFFKATGSTQDTYARPLADFITFSTKPWTYILPPTNNPVFGNFSASIISNLQSNWGYFWTNNHFTGEMSAGYLGLANILLLIYYFKNRKTLATGVTTHLILVTILFSLFLYPPYFTFNSLTFYLPSYLIYVFIPMFRVLVRGTFIISLIVTLIAGIAAQHIINKYKMIGSVLISALLIFSFIEHYVPIKFTKIDNMPEVYAKLDANTPSIIYPNAYTKSYIFWFYKHKSPLINPEDYVNKSNTFFSNEFTNMLLSCEGLVSAHELGAKHLIVYDPKINGYSFNNSRGLKLIGTYPKYPDIDFSSKILKIDNISSIPETNIYEILPTTNCN